MNEKRFEVIFYGDVINCVRDEKGREYNLHELIDLLMDQQATINKLNDEEKTDKTDFDFTIKQGEVITKFSLGEDKILFETTQDYETIQTLSKWLYSMYDEIQKLKKELKWKREEIKALIEESERDE